MTIFVRDGWLGAMRLHSRSWNKIVYAACCVLTVLPLAACEDAGDAATLGFSDEGDSQNITVSSTPPGASCTLGRGGEVIGTVAATPGSVSVVETDASITVNCTAPGYTGSTVVPADVAGSALVGMVSDLLPNNVYPENINVTMTPGTSGASPASPAPEQFAGIGVAIMEAAGQPVVLNLLSGSPAARAGLLPGDVITTVDGKHTQGLALANVSTAIRGAPGTKVALTVLRGSARQEMQFVVTRVTITAALPAASNATAAPAAAP